MVTFFGRDRKMQIRLMPNFFIKIQGIKQFNDGSFLADVIKRDVLRHNVRISASVVSIFFEC